MYPFGNVWGPSGGARPNGMKVCFVSGKVEFFLGDHWILVGPARIVQSSRGVRPDLPDANKFFDERRDLDDGSDVWRQWGPRVN